MTAHRFVRMKMMTPLSFFILAILQFTGTQNPGTGHLAPGSFNDTAIVTVAAFLPGTDDNTTEVIFNERAHILRFSRQDKDYDLHYRFFENALRSKDPVRVVTDGLSGTLLNAAAPSAAELAFYREMHAVMLPGEVARRVDVSAIDTATFDYVGQNQNWPAFNLCVKIVPDYAKAKEIFDYCAAQSCHLPGPKAVNPCIPFQYVIDGCYARAHKMRWIIEKHFGYCSEKVFSYATVSNHQLAVKADKWGGCCVEWWYHVTPLIRVKTQFGKRTMVMLYVIDPGMFDKPVSLSTWLKAQKSTTCNGNANVDTYSIQPSSAYTPTYPTGTPYATDPNYVQTNNTLTSYASWTTCN